MANTTRGPSVFGHDRFFYVANYGWYFEAREGARGPFFSRASADHALESIKAAHASNRARSKAYVPEQPTG